MKSTYDINYQRMRDKQITRDDFYLTLETFKLAHIRKARNSYRLDEHIALEIYDDTFLEITQDTMTIHKFENAFNQALHRRRIDGSRKTKSRTEKETVTEDIDETAATVNDVEDSVIKKEANHWQVIDSLLRLSPYDSATTAIVNGIKQDASLNATPTGIGSKLGYHPEFVKRKLRKLSRYYDEAVFGSVHDLFASVS